MKPVEELVSYFYTDPRPERLYGFMDQFEGLVGKENWGAYPPLVGFFAVVFSAHPDQIERLLPAVFTPKSAVTLANALRLSGAQAFFTKLKLNLVRRDPKLQAELGGLPARSEDVEIKTPTHLDIMWGAAFASGDKRYVSKIVHFLEHTVNRSEQIAVDVFKMTAAMTGGPKEIMKEVRGKYGDARALELVVVSAALWGLRSNALQHPFVERTLEEYAAGHQGTLAAVALSNLRSNKS
ncbi:MAG: hypothetical protein WBX25_15025 [Rhodomicrobium sp.]